MGTKMSPKARLLVLTAVMASLLEIIDTSIVNVAIPNMMGNLGTTLDEISWVVTGYIIANAIVLPISGWLGQQLGRKNYYTACIILFTIASVACGFAPNLSTLVVFRIFQGLAGGALLPTSQALIYEAFPKEQAGMASAIYGMSVMIGPTLGPTLGGYLTDNFGWRSIFNVNLPVGIVVAILSWLLVEEVGFDPNAKVSFGKKAVPVEAPPKPARVRVPIDIWGLVFLISGIGCMQYVLERGQPDDWFDSKAILICTIVAIFSLVSLIWWEVKGAKHPLLQLKHFRQPTFRSGVFLMAGLGSVLYGLIFVIPVFVGSIQGLTATQTGLLFIPGALAGALVMPFVGQQLRKRDPRLLILVGTVSLASAAFLIGRFDSQTSVEGMFFPLLLRGAAMAFLFVPINTVVLMQFSGASIGEAAGMLNLFRQIGGSIGIATISTLMSRYQDQSFITLSSHVTWFDPAAVHAHYLLSGGMNGKMETLLGLGSTSLDTLKMLFYKVRREAYVLAFQKTLVQLVCVYLLTLIPLFFMKKPTKVSGPLPDAH
jgi:DHA2 family multidrug resistance protein